MTKKYVWGTDKDTEYWDSDICNSIEECIQDYEYRCQCENEEKVKTILIGEVREYEIQKVDIVNLSGLQNHIDEELLLEKVTKKQEIKYEIDKLFKKALVILYQKDFEKYITLEDFITKEFKELDLTKRNTLCKKLKGEYKKDKELLQKYVEREDLDIELYYINKIKNYDIVKMFFDTEDVELLEAIKKFIIIDDNIKVTLKFE